MWNFRFSCVHHHAFVRRAREGNSLTTLSLKYCSQAQGLPCFNSKSKLTAWRSLDPSLQMVAGCRRLPSQLPRLTFLSPSWSGDHRWDNPWEGDCEAQQIFPCVQTRGDRTLNQHGLDTLDGKQKNVCKSQSKLFQFKYNRVQMSKYWTWGA